MGNLMWVKRLLPFFATFAVGIFVASFFVNISGPQFGYRERGKCRHEMRELRIENEQLREDNMRLRLESGDSSSDFGPEFNDEFLDSQSVEQPVLPPPPPPRPVRQRSVHLK